MEFVENFIRTIATTTSEDFYQGLLSVFAALGVACWLFLFLNKIGFFNLSIKKLLIGASFYTFCAGVYSLFNGATYHAFMTGLGYASMVFLMTIFTGMCSKERKSN